MADEHDRMPLDDRVVVVTDPQAALAASDSGASVVVVVAAPPDPAGEEAAAVVADLESRGRRVVLFVGDLGDPAARSALGELLSELFDGADP